MKTQYFTCKKDGKISPSLAPLILSENETYASYTFFPILILIGDGELAYSYGKKIAHKAEKDEIILIPAGYEVKIQSLTESSIALCSIENIRSICIKYSLDELIIGEGGLTSNTRKDFRLQFTPQITLYLQSLETIRKMGKHCLYYNRIKLDELFFLMNMYYTKDELSKFFSPILSKDISFTQKLLLASGDALSIEDLAKAVDLSPSGFNKRFKKIFNMTPYKWLQERRAERIYQALLTTDLPLKQIAIDEHLANTGELNQYCLKFFKATPLNIRKHGPLCCINRKQKI